MIFEQILCIAVVVTGVAWLAEKFFFARQRRKAANAAVEEFNSQQQRIDARFADEHADETRQALRDEKLRQPWWLEYTAGLFVVVFAVFFVRSFVAEPYKIPSGSMIPTLLVGDFILVNKFEYGLRMPLSNQRITQGSPLRRGDVVVFRYPLDESTDYIKRVIGLPGDTVMYAGKTLTINGHPVPQTALPDYYDDEQGNMMKQFSETLDGTRTNQIINNPSQSSDVRGRQLKIEEGCTYNEQGVICKVPPGHYFMMGDNRDDSEDSRYWGFVPDKDIIGRAFFVWMHFENWHPSFKRAGSIK
jgi:signal peptidase I